MSLLQRINKPEYVFQPLQLLRRLVVTCPPPQTEIVLDTPWHLPLQVHLSDAIGQSVWRFGVYDLVVSEALWRLTEPGETAVDAGANLGYMSGLLAYRLGPQGTLWSFEPQPQLFGELTANASRWRARGHIAKLQFIATALSREAGTAHLQMDAEFAANRGTAHLARGNDTSSNTIAVTTARLVDLLPAATKVGVLKLDVEGHELAVLEGAAPLLTAKTIRDIVFEDHQGGDSEVCQMLRQHGYHLFALSRSFWGPQLLSPTEAHRRPAWLPPNFLATTDPVRAANRFEAQGWQCLHPHSD